MLPVGSYTHYYSTLVLFLQFVFTIIQEIRLINADSIHQQNKYSFYTLVQSQKIDLTGQ